MKKAKILLRLAEGKELDKITKIRRNVGKIGWKLIAIKELQIPAYDDGFLVQNKVATSNSILDIFNSVEITETESN